MEYKFSPRPSPNYFELNCSNITISINNQIITHASTILIMHNYSGNHIKIFNEDEDLIKDYTINITVVHYSIDNYNNNFVKICYY